MSESNINSILALGENKYLKDSWAREQINNSQNTGHSIIDTSDIEYPSRRKVQFLNSNITDDDISDTTIINFGITRYVQKPHVTVGTYTFNGEEQGPLIEGLTEDLIVIDAKKVNAGTYTLTISLKDITTMAWDDLTTSDLTYEYTINKLYLEVPDISPHVSPIVYEYDRSSHAPTIGEYDANYIMITGNIEPLIEPGDYTIYIDLKDKNNTCWSNDTTAMISRQWRIDKKRTIVTVDKTNITLNSLTLYQDIEIHYNDEDIEEREIDIDIDSLSEDIFTVEHISGSTYRVTYLGVGEGSFTIYVLNNNHYRSNGIEVTVTSKLAPELNECTWEQISQVSASGNASSCWNIGDCKEITLNGKVGDYLTLTNYKTYVYIIGFDHNSSIEGSGISFGCFKTEYGQPVALCDSTYETYNNDGIKNFSINHWKDSSLNEPLSYGGWKACDMRYDILGSTDIAPSNYGSAKNTSSTGYTPSQTCKSNPVSNTLMAALPSDLRSVMKLICKYTDNGYEYYDSSYSELVQAVTNSYDYLPLMSEYEIDGKKDAGNTYEKNTQSQYDYYKNGNAKFKYQHTFTSDYCTYWLRSRNLVSIGNTPKYWCDYEKRTTTEGLNAHVMEKSYGLAPVFLV